VKTRTDRKHRRARGATRPLPRTFCTISSESQSRQAPETEQAQDAQWQTEATKVKTNEAFDFWLRNGMTA
jgi:hypothetical protein